jgi:hypothetical protein
VEELRAAIDQRYRAPERLILINFRGDIAARMRERSIAHVPENWYTRIVV